MPIHPVRHRLRAPLRFLLCGLIGLLPLAAAPQIFDIDAQPADEALAAFTQQTKVNLLYAPAELHEVRSTPVHGEFEPGDALVRLLRETGFGARLENGAYLITRIPRPRSELVGRITTSNGAPNGGTLVAIPDLHRSTITNRHGEYRFDEVPLGTYRIVANREGFHPLHIDNVRVTADLRTYLAPNVLRSAHETNQLEPVVVEGHLNRRGPLDPGPTVWGPRRAGGNLDLTRTLNDALPFIVYDRDRITRSGVVNLNDFLRRELLDTDATVLPPDQNGNGDLTASGSSNLNLRGFASDETVVLVNGRRLPEILTTTNLSGGRGGYQPPDVNFIPLSLVQQVQVLPASASALYSGNAIGGVINILLRPEGEHRRSEVTTTYTNATEGFDAPYSAVSLLHSESLLGGKLNLRFNANFVQTRPATDSELKYHRDNSAADEVVTDNDALHRATPNVRSTSATPLFPNTPFRVTSVAPGADGTGGLAAFDRRQGIRNFALYDSPGNLASALKGVDYPYGREQRRALYFASAVFTVSDWLELGLDAAYSNTTINRGFDVFKGDLLLRKANPLNPFGTDARVSLFETPVELGQDYSEARIDFYSLVGSALVTLPWDWKLAIDTQYSRSSTKYRGVADIDRNRWQALVDRGDYNPLRDTQVFGPPQAFYDEVLIYTGARDEFVTLGDYETFDGAFRVTHENLNLPTGRAVANFGADYRIMTLKGYDAVRRYGDGSLQRLPERWQGRTLERVSLFGELQAPLYPRQKLPAWIDTIETDLATRVIIADTAAETNVAPTIALKLGLANGLTFRGSFTTSNRFPTPYMSRNRGNGVDAGTGRVYVNIKDPRRDGDEYEAEQVSVLNPGLRIENAVTQTFGVIFERGDRNRFRASVDFFDTRKTNEIVGLGPTELLNLEEFFPERVARAAPAPSDPYDVGRITEFRTGAFNLASRHSQNFMTTLDYARRDVLGGTLELRSRLVWFTKFTRQIFPEEPSINEITDPSGASGLLEYRATFGGGWSTRSLALGFDGQYFHSRRLPEKEWAIQGARTIDPYWQTDVYVQGDIGRWLLPKKSRLGLKGQLRVNNVFKKGYPKYAWEPSGAGVQPYGDWRGRTYSVSLTAEF